MRTTPPADLAFLRELYDDAEIAILFDWLGISRPVALRGINLQEDLLPPLGDSDGPPAAGPVRLHHSHGLENEHNVLANAVARIALQSVRDRLPCWTYKDPAGDFWPRRPPIPKRPSQVAFMTRLLAEIRWFGFGVFLDWAEAYYATYLPGIDRYVVTVSTDKAGMYGYSDLALRTFPREMPFSQGVEATLLWWWKTFRSDYVDCPWYFCTTEGEVSREQAEAWADRLWGAEELNKFKRKGARDSVSRQRADHIISQWHTLVDDVITDAPGRMEQRKIMLRYCGKGQWQMVAGGSDFVGLEPRTPAAERMSTRKLIDWVLEADAEEHSQHACTGADEDDDYDLPTLGPWAARLLEIAGAVGAGYCAGCLRAYTRGEWPPEPKPPKILRVDRIERKGIWIRIYRTVFVVETSNGPHHLSPPDANGYATLEEASSNHSRRWWTVKLSAEIRRQVADRMPEYEVLCDQITR